MKFPRNDYIVATRRADCFKFGLGGQTGTCRSRGEEGEREAEEAEVMSNSYELSSRY